MLRALSLPALAALIAFLAPAAPAAAQDAEPVLYVTQYKIQQARLDSLVTLTERFDTPWHNFIAERVPGYQRSYYRHDTGDDYNFVIMTMYPDWDYVRGDEIPLDNLFEEFSQTWEGTETEDQVNAMFEWAFEGAEHVDNIYRPIAASGD